MAKGAYISGRTDGTFDGDAQITRAEFVTILARMVEPQNVGFRFSDVPVGHWAYPSVSTAASVGWVAGMPDGTFQPTKPITRAEAMTILNRVLHRGVGSSSVLGNYTVFPDNLNSSAWYYYEVIEASNSHEYIGTRPNETWTSNAVEYEYDMAKYERPEP